MAFVEHSLKVINSETKTKTVTVIQLSSLGPFQKPMMVLVCRNSQRLLAVNCFRRKSSKLGLDRVLNTSLVVTVDIETLLYGYREIKFCFTSANRVRTTCLCWAVKPVGVAWIWLVRIDWWCSILTGIQLMTTKQWLECGEMDKRKKCLYIDFFQ